MNNIILLATYWNEIEWIDRSLEQIRRIDPIEIIICDGNFDPRIPNYSTDGTREKIEQFVQEESHRARMISAIRRPSMLRGVSQFMACGCPNNSLAFSVSRMKSSLKTQLLINEYRVNQALTFAHMTKISNEWKLDRWVMSYDADQFYTDELISFFEITNEQSDYCLITADEYTFPFSFENYTTKYELRKWNNMPHKIRANMAVYPTRHFVLENRFSGHENYQDLARSIHGGVYHHYKFRADLGRIEAGYSLGDRQAPDPRRYQDLQNYAGAFPASIAPALPLDGAK